MTSAQDFPADKMVSFIWWFYTREATREEAEKFRARLWMPPTPDTPIPAKSPWSAENEMAAFSSFRAESGM